MNSDWSNRLFMRLMLTLRCLEAKAELDPIDTRALVIQLHHDPEGAIERLAEMLKQVVSGI